VSVIYINSYQFAAPAGATDPYFSNVSLLLHGDGANGSTTIVDSSPSPKTVTAVGNAQISTAQSKFGGSSIAFDGTNDYLQIPASSDFDFGTEDFTVEFWLYQTSANQYATIIDVNYGTSPNFSFQRDLTLLKYILYLNGTGTIIQETSLHSLNTWHHYAIVRNGTGVNNVVIYRDGVNVGSGTYAGNAGNSSVTFKIGGSPTGPDSSGYIDDFRVTKGVARYTANFTPPTAPFPDA
jgi:hypothetical protein